MIFTRSIIDFLWDNKVYFSKGKRGFIFLSIYKNKKFVIKTKNPQSTAVNTVFREYENNVLLNKHNIGPRVFYFDDERDFIIRDFVDGLSFFDWVKDIKSKRVILNLLLSVLDQCKVMDFIGLNKLEMNRPHKDLLVVNNLPVIIDFERCKISLKPKNVTQFMQFIVSNHLAIYLLELGVVLDKDRLLFLAERYKNNLKLKSKLANKDVVDLDFEKLKKELSAFF